MVDVEVERRLKDSVSSFPVISSTLASLDPRLASSLHVAVASSSTSYPLQAPQGPTVSFTNNKPFPAPPVLAKTSGHASLPDSILHSSPAREEGEVPESELDPDTRRRLLILQHGQDTRDHSLGEASFPVRPPIPVPAAVPVPQVPSRGTWFPVEGEMSPRHLNEAGPKEYPFDSDPVLIQKQRPPQLPFYHGAENSLPPGRSLHDTSRLPHEALHRDERLRANQSVSGYHFTGEEAPLGRSFSSRDLEVESGRIPSNVDTAAGVLQSIAMRCGTKVEFRPNLVASNELQFFIEVWFAGEKIGERLGRTRKEAQHHAAEGSLKNLAFKYLSNGNNDPINGDPSRSIGVKDSWFSSDVNFLGNPPMLREEGLALSTASGPSRPSDSRLDSSKKLMSSVSALKELCMVEGLGISYHAQSAVPSSSVHKDEIHAQVEIDGQVLGKGMGCSWDEAKSQAAEKALGSLKSMLCQVSMKRQGSPRPLQGMSNKRSKLEHPRLQCMSSSRYA